MSERAGEPLPTLSVRHGARRAGAALVRLGVVAGVVGTLAGCSNIDPVAPAAGPITDPTQLYMDLTLNHRAINLSTVAGYNTLQLTATPRDALGNPMTDLPAPVFSSPDSRVEITPEGLVTAVGAATDVRVTATLTVGPVTHTDTARINVTTLTPTPVDTLSIDPLPPTTTAWPLAPSGGGFGVLLLQFAGIGTSPDLPVRTVDATGTIIPGLQVEFQSLDPAIAMINRWPGGTNSNGLPFGTPQILRTGQAVRMVARTWAYDVEKADTVTFTVTPPRADDITIKLGAAGQPTFFLGEQEVSFPPAEVRIVPGGVVGFQNQLTDSIEVTFDDPTQATVLTSPESAACDLLVLFIGPGPYCNGGNLSLGEFDPEDFFGSLSRTLQLRQFPTPGVYPFHLPNGATGRIVVTTEFD